MNLPVDKTSRQIKGFGTITFVFPEHAAKAYCELDGSVLSGRMLHLLPVKSKPEPEESEESKFYKIRQPTSGVTKVILIWGGILNLCTSLRVLSRSLQSESTLQIRAAATGIRFHFENNPIFSNL